MVAEVYKYAGLEAAKIAGQSPEMDRVANELARLVRSEAAKHRRSGDFSDNILVRKVRGRRGVMDREVVADDPLAAVKEFGHVIRNEKNGPELGHVKGQFNMANAIKRLPEVRGD